MNKRTACVRAALVALFLTTAACGGDAFGTAPDPALDGGGPDGAVVAVDGATEADAGAQPDVLLAEAAADTGVGTHIVLPDAGADASGEPDASAVADAGHVEAACTPVTHDNGVGQRWQDCTAYGTHSEAQAMAACVAYALDPSQCAANNVCGGDVSFIGTVTSANNYIWGYKGQLAGLVAAGGSCPVSTNPASKPWN